MLLNQLSQRRMPPRFFCREGGGTATRPRQDCRRSVRAYRQNQGFQGATALCARRLAPSNRALLARIRRSPPGDDAQLYTAPAASHIGAARQNPNHSTTWLPNVDTIARVANKSLDPYPFLAKNNSTAFCEMLDGPSPVRPGIGERQRYARHP
jgi:hypothetical protein